MKGKLYVAYGSNLDIEQMIRRCPGALPVRRAWLKDYRLVFRGWDGHGVASVEPASGAKVPVAIYSVTPTDIAALDRYEGYPRLYVRQSIRGLGFLYAMQPEYGPALPSRDYLWTIIRGYYDWGLPLRYLERAVSRCQKEVAGCAEKARTTA